LAHHCQFFLVPTLLSGDRVDGRETEKRERQRKGGKKETSEGELLRGIGTTAQCQVAVYLKPAADVSLTKISTPTLPCSVLTLTGKQQLSWCFDAVGMGGFSRGETHGCVCRWVPVPLAVGHDLAYLLWNSSHLGSKHYSLSLLFLLQICLYATFHGRLSSFLCTIIMLICYSFAMGAL
jgi:hypothetical protein